MTLTQIQASTALLNMWQPFHMFYIRHIVPGGRHVTTVRLIDEFDAPHFYLGDANWFSYLSALLNTPTGSRGIRETDSVYR